MAKIFAYRGMIGMSALREGANLAEGLLISDAVINPWDDPGQLGFVCNAELCQISQEAIDLLKLIKPSGDDIGDVDVFQADKHIVLNWLGGPLRMIDPKNEDITGSSDYNPSLLETLTLVPNDPPEDFMSVVDGILEE